MSGFRLALVVSHPIQHFCPQYVSFAQNKNMAFKVFFASTMGFKKYVDPTFKREIAWDNLNLDKFDHEFLNGDQLLEPDNKLDAPSIDNALTAFNPDAVICYGYFQPFQRRAYNWAKKHQKKIAYISDSMVLHDRSFVKEFLKRPFLKRYFSRVNYFLSVGDANETYYKKFGVTADKILRMHFPIDIISYEQAYQNRKELRENIKRQFNIPSNELVLSMVGKIVAAKNQDQLIDVLQILEKRGIYLHLLLIGTGDMQQEWEQKAKVLTKSKVHFTGFVNTTALTAYYAATDIYVHSASIDRHSLAISEAIYMGCPAIISDRLGSFGPTDDVQDNKNGYVYQFGNIQQLADKIEALVKDEKTREGFNKYSHELGVQFQQKSHFQIIDKLITLVKG